MGALSPFQAFTQELQNFTIFTPALTCILVKNDIVKCLTQNAGLVSDVLVTPIARTTDDDRPSGCRHVVDRVDQGLNGVGVVAVVGNDCRAPVVKYIEPSRYTLDIADEGGQALNDVLPRQIDGPSSRYRSHDIFSLKSDLTLSGQWDVGQWHPVYFLAFLRHDVVIFNKHHAFALGPVCCQDGMLRVLGKKGHAARAMLGHCSNRRVGGIENGHAIGGYIQHNHPFKDGQIFQCGDVIQTQMVAGAYVRHDGHFAAIKSQAFSQHTATRGFKDSSVHIRVHQHIAGAAGTAAVPIVNLASIDIHAVGVGHAYPHTLRFEQVRGQSDRGGFAIGAGNCNHRDTAIITGLEHAFDDSLADVAALAK